jgi:hypothetical protein
MGSRGGTNIVKTNETTSPAGNRFPSSHAAMPLHSNDTC